MKNNNRSLLLTVLGLICCIAVVICGIVVICRSKTKKLSMELFAFDTYMTMDIDVAVGFTEGDTLKAGLKERTLELEQLFKGFAGIFSSTDAPASQTDTATFTPPTDLRVTLETALLVGRLTNGAFDITEAPLINAWGFINKNYRIPSEKELKDLCGRVDYSRLNLSEDGTLSIPDGMQLDLGGCAKGYLGDALRAELTKYEVKSAMLNLGGNMVLIGSKPDGSDYKIGIADPLNPDSIVGYVSVSDTNVITSGGYLRYFIGEDGETYWHILNPKTGMPAKSGLLSVTVIGKDGCLCDCLSTALFVVGRDRAFNFYNSYGNDLGIEFILVNDDGTIECTDKINPRFNRCE